MSTYLKTALFFSFGCTSFVSVVSLAAISDSARQQSSIENCKIYREQYDEAVRLFQENQKLLSAHLFSELRFTHCVSLEASAWFGFSLALLELGERNQARRVLMFAPELREASERKRFHILQAWLSESSDDIEDPISRERFNLWTARRNRSVFQQSLNRDAFRSDRDSLLELQKKIEAAESKSPWISGVTSAVLPGAGQAYNGHYQTAALAFVINAIFLSATLELHRKDLPAAAFASGTLFSVTYVGNILSAVQGAHGVNRARRDPFERELRDALLPELNFRQ